MNELIPFDFENRTINCFAKGEEFWVAVKDIANALGYPKSTKPSGLVRQVPEEWKGMQPLHTPGGIQNMLCLSEQGLYFFLGRSDKEKALPFQKKVAGEILPQIRKTGNYSAPVAVEDLKKSLMIAQSSLNTYKRLWEESRRTIKRHENRNFLTSDDKREILTLHVKGYPVSAIQQITKKGRTRIKNFLDEFYSMDDSAQDVLFDEWEKADNLGIREESA